jgi:hypothetical protein
MVVSALDRKNLPARGLTASDFKVSSHGTVARVTSSEYWHNPDGKVVVLLDIGGSMQRRSFDDRWKIADALAQAFVASAPPQEQISLLTFSLTVHQQFSASLERKPIEDWLSSPAVSTGQVLWGDSWGDSAFLEAIRAGIKEISPTRVGDSIYIITDYGATSDRKSFAKIEQDLTDSGIRVFAALLDTDKAALYVAERNGPAELTELVRESGGRVEARFLPNPYFPPSRRDVLVLDASTTKAIDSTTFFVLNQINNFYVLRIDRAKSFPGKKRKWSVAVVDAQGHKRKDVTIVAHPYRLPACQ